jgi:hypothetical protein
MGMTKKKYDWGFVEAKFCGIRVYERWRRFGLGKTGKRIPPIWVI